MTGKGATVALALGVCLAAALGGLFAAGVLGVPDAGLEDNAWGEVDDERIEVLTTVWIDNPNPGVELDDLTLEYALAMNGVDLAEGTATDVAVPAGNSTTELRTDLRYERLPDWWVSHVRNDEASALEAGVTAHAEVGPFSGSPSHTYEDEIETDLEPMVAAALAEQEGEYSLSPVATDDGIQRELDVVEPTVEIRDTDAEWGTVDDETTELHLTYEVYNPNAYPLATPSLTGEMEFNDRVVGDWQAHEVELLDADRDATIPPRSSRDLTFVVELDNDDVVDWFATHVDAGEVTDAEFRAQLALSVGGETVTIPENGDAIRCDYEMTTAIFVEQEAGLSDGECTLVPWATPNLEESDADDGDGPWLDDDPPSI
ncbi:Water stress and hypersensitive response domain-containing protein [Halobiforma lacisalsi AJ5]|uniref:water stress and HYPERSENSITIVE response domain-containing protein n=1 Tax=Natronobacterium lacisalsi AJ5 TaxID=358396 RepID=M0LRT2_NATLA|nr:LEA type 2 family protein [Halobiforma lacisalsi]APW97048.1 Water stress and hypersensitive response domain-containing protein [Halobiforma lacisalsi AJ5]EMA34765.1 Water Stress and Hypersensitive response domain-containing protein [Halobiforma lacisalsi AJ5]